MVLIVITLIPAAVLLAKPSQERQAEARAQAAVEAGDYPLAVNELSLAASLAIDPSQYWPAIADNALSADDPYTAIHFLERAEAAGKLELPYLVMLGEIYLQTGDLELAVETFEAAQAVFGPDQSILTHLYELHTEAGEFTAAAAVLSELVALDPENSESQLELALLLAATDPEAALDLLGQLEETLPEKRDSLRELGLAIRRARAVSNQPEYISLAAGRALAGAGEWELANAAFQRAVEFNPSFAEAWAYLGESQDRLGLMGGRSLEIAYGLNPDSAAVNILYALHYQKMGSSDLALTHLENARKTDPENPKLVAELASIVADGGDIEGALTLFNQAIQLAPEDNLYWKLLAGFSIENEIRTEEIGVSAARTATLLDQDDPEAFSLLGQAYLVAGNPVLAERFLRMAVGIDSTHAPAVYHLGVLYLTNGQDQLALEQFERAKSLAPGTLLAQQADDLIAKYLQ